MTFKEVFGGRKPVIGMIHTNESDKLTTLELAQKEIEIYLKYEVYPLVENYFGSADDCEQVLDWLHSAHPDATYGVNILGDYQRAIELAIKYGAKFIQIDSVCGHLNPDDDEEFAEALSYNRKGCNAIILGGVRFKYQSVRSGRSTKEDLLLGMKRSDAIVCTGEGTGKATPLSKVEKFKSVVGDFPVIVGAGVTIDTVKDAFDKGDGAIIGSWFKEWHSAENNVNEEYVKELVEKIHTNKVQTNTIVTSIKRIKAKEVATWFKDIMSQPDGLRHLLSDKKAWGAFSIYSHLRRSDGKPKLAFPSRSKAQKSADSMSRKYNATFSVYKCMFCDGWHISKTGELPQENHKSPVSEQYDKALVGQPALLDSEKIMSTNIPDLAPVYGGFRGRTLSSQNQRYAWNALIKAGIHQVIDLRADYKSDHYQKLCQHSGVDYFYYPVATKPTDIELMVAKFPEFCRLIDKGGFYIACAMGLHRTDIALCTYWMFYAADKGVEPPQIRGYRQEEGHDTSKIMRILNAFYNYLTERDGKEPMSISLFKERKNIINELSKN